MNKPEIFKKLKELGVASVVVHFSGGGDEGGVDGIDMLDENKKKLDINVEGNSSRMNYNNQTKEWTHEVPDTEMQRLVKELVAPVYDRYHSFAGEFYVSGTVDYDVKAGTIAFNKRERIYTYEDSHEEL